jgi:hypothetical protein
MFELKANIVRHTKAYALFLKYILFIEVNIVFYLL